MADPSSRPSPDNSGLGRPILPPTHTGLFFRGPLVSVYYHRQPAFTSKRQAHAQAKALVAFDLAAGDLRRFIGASWRSERIAGRGLHFIAPGLWHEVRWERETDLIEIYYEPGFFREWSPERVAALLGSETLPEAADDPVVWNFALAICSWCAEQAPSASIITEIGGLMGKRLVSRHGESRARRKGPRLTDDQRRRLDAYIQTNIAKRISVPDLAQAVSMSVSHFVVLCRDTTGRTPTDYLRESRLWKAHAMMRTGSHRRSEIARACGFYDSSHLNREFKRFFKHPPGPLAAENVYPSR